MPKVRREGIPVFSIGTRPAHRRDLCLSGMQRHRQEARTEAGVAELSNSKTAGMSQSQLLHAPRLYHASGLWVEVAQRRA